MSLIWDANSNMICPMCGTLICKILNPIYRGSIIQRNDCFIYRIKSPPLKYSTTYESFKCCKCGLKPLLVDNFKDYPVYKILN